MDDRYPLVPIHMYMHGSTLHVPGEQKAKTKKKKSIEKLTNENSCVESDGWLGSEVFMPVGYRSSRIARLNLFPALPSHWQLPSLCTKSPDMHYWLQTPATNGASVLHHVTTESLLVPCQTPIFPEIRDFFSGMTSPLVDPSRCGGGETFFSLSLSHGRDLVVLLSGAGRITRGANEVASWRAASGKYE